MNEWAYYNFMNMGEYTQILKTRMTNGLWLRYFKETCGVKLGMFSYENLPDGLTSQIIEQALLFNSMLCFADIGGLGGVTLCKYTPSGKLNYYLKPEKVDLYALNGEPLGIQVKYDDIVPFRDNRMDIPPFINIITYIDKLIEIERTLSMNIKLLRLPVFFTGTREQVAQLNKLVQKIDNFEPFAITDKKLADTIKGTDIKMPYSPLDTFSLLEKYQEKCVSSIGIYSTDRKRERLVTAEIEANNDYVDLVYQDMLNERKSCLEESNKKFGTNMKLIESYVIIKEEDNNLEADKAKKIAVAESVGDNNGMENT